MSTKVIKFSAALRGTTCSPSVRWKNNMTITKVGLTQGFQQDSSGNAHNCRELGRQQVLAGRRQGLELDLLGSFPFDFRLLPAPPPYSTGTGRERETKVRSERGRSGEKKRGKQTEWKREEAEM